LPAALFVKKKRGGFFLLTEEKYFFKRCFRCAGLFSVCGAFFAALLKKIGKNTCYLV
jgi:hypothetical protein